jgi:hypothetical protein
MNLEELYEKRKKRDEKQAAIYRKVLSRAHDHIRREALKGGLPCTWFSVPPVVMGVPNYDQAGCIAYLLDQLQENKFVVRFYYPNHIFITWNHFVPKYVRDEIRQKTGVELDEYGNPVPQEEDDEEVDVRQSDAYQQLARSALGGGGGSGGRGGDGGSGGGGRRGGNRQASKSFTPIETYRPSGKMVYREDTLNRLQNRLPSSGTGNDDGRTRGRGRNAGMEMEMGMETGRESAGYSIPVYDPNTFNDTYSYTNSPMASRAVYY